MLAVALVAVGSALSALVVAPAPSYDPWAWLLWGREIAGGELSTAEGPAFKPLPVVATTLLSFTGDAAPAAWVVLARAGALLALWLAFRLGRRLAADVLAVGAPGGWPLAAGALAAAGVGLCGAYLWYSATGIITGWLLALALAGIEAWRAGRPRLALACGIGCALLQVESWPFLASFGLLLWRRHPRDRPLLAAAAVAVPALWLVPELLGSGDLLRSAERARVPNPGQPALADVPAIASIREAVALPLWPLWIGVAALALVATRGRAGSRFDPQRTLRAPGDASAPRAALLPALAGLAWVSIVAAMAQLGGFSGEPRYALPGAALVSISGAVGLVVAAHRLTRPEMLERFAGPWTPRSFDRLGPGVRPRSSEGFWGPWTPRLFDRLRWGAAVLAIAAAPALAAVPRVGDAARIPATQERHWGAASELADAVELAGGREAVLACGRPYVGPLRGPLMAYALDVRKHVVEPDLPPRPPGVVFQSRPTGGGAPEPATSPAFAEVARNERWRVLASCRVRMP